MSVATASQRATVTSSIRQSLVHWADSTARRTTEHLSTLELRQLLRRKVLIRATANLAVVGLVVALPFAAVSRPAAAVAPAGASVAFDDAPRAQVAPRGLVAGDRNPVTATAPSTGVAQYTLSKADTLSSIANFYKISPESIAFSNGITDPSTLQIGREIMIPPAEGALYTVKEGDTPESVASRFKVETAAIMSYNRVYFEPEHFAPGQLIFIPGAEIPALVYQAAAPVQTVAISRPAAPSQVSASGRLAWPVGGVITQRYWSAHRAIDIAAPYGSGIATPEAGVVISTGWVAVGGIHVRVRLDSGLVTGFYHMSVVNVAVGQRVAAGQVVGAIGLTGITTGPHVHWECQVGGALVDCLSQ